MRDWRLSGLHFLIASRKEPDIRDFFDPTGNDEIEMRNAEIDQDIENFVSKKLTSDLMLQKLDRWHDIIQNTLTTRAQGV